MSVLASVLRRVQLALGTACHGFGDGVAEATRRADEARTAKGHSSVVPGDSDTRPSRQTVADDDEKGDADG